MPWEQVNLDYFKRSLRFELWRNAARVKGKHPDDCIDTAEVNVKWTDYMNQIAVSVAMSILTEHLSTARAPENWWEAVKERWLPSWLLDWFPVRYSYFELEALYIDPFDMGMRVLKAKKIPPWEIKFKISN